MGIQGSILPPGPGAVSWQAAFEATRAAVQRWGVRGQDAEAVAAGRLWGR